MAILVQFSEVYDAAPSLPRPLRSQYILQYITLSGLRQGARIVAPLTEQEQSLLKTTGLNTIVSLQSDSPATKHCKCLMIHYNKAKEYVLVHSELSAWYKNVNRKVENTATAVSFAIAAVVLFDAGGTALALYLAGAVAFVSMMKSWCTYANYDTLESSHELASLGFRGISSEIEDMLCVLGDLKASQVAENFGGAPMKKESGPIRKLLNQFKKLDTYVRETSPTEALDSVSDRVVDGADAVESAVEATVPSTKERLRLLYRKALQYRGAHSIFETKYNRLRTLLAFLHLVLSTVTSSAMFMKTPDIVVSTLTSVLAALNTIIGATAFGDMESKHAHGRIAWASVMRSFETTLMLDSDEQIRVRFFEYGKRFKEVLHSTARLNALHLLRDPDDRKKPLFDLIIESPDIFSTATAQAVNNHQGLGSCFRCFNKWAVPPSSPIADAKVSVTNALPKFLAQSLSLEERFEEVVEEVKGPKQGDDHDEEKGLDAGRDEADFSARIYGADIDDLMAHLGLGSGKEAAKLVATLTKKPLPLDDEPDDGTCML